MEHQPVPHADRDGSEEPPRDELTELRAEVERWERDYPCDGGCTYDAGPDETCSRHGRRPAEVWAIVNDLAPERNRFAARLARVEALADEWRGKRDNAIVSAEARRGLRDENDLRLYAHIMSKRLVELGTALSDPESAATEEAGR